LPGKWGTCMGRLRGTGGVELRRGLRGRGSIWEFRWWGGARGLGRFVIAKCEMTLGASGKDLSTRISVLLNGALERGGSVWPRRCKGTRRRWNCGGVWPVNKGRVNKGPVGGDSFGVFLLASGAGAVSAAWRALRLAEGAEWNNAEVANLRGILLLGKNRD